MKKLSEYVKDFIIITVSVTIAFWVENFREARKDASDTKALLIKIKSELNAQEGYLKSLATHADIHAKRFDSLVRDLRDKKNEKNQLLANISLAYLPYIADVSENSGFESLKNSGLLSNVQNDTLVTVLFHLNSRMKRNLYEYNEAWKRAQDRLRNLFTHIYGSEIDYDFSKSKLLLRNPGAIVMRDDLRDQIIFELVSWITIMKQYSIFMDQNREQINELILMLDREID